MLKIILLIIQLSQFFKSVLEIAKAYAVPAFLKQMRGIF